MSSAPFDSHLNMRMLEAVSAVNTAPPPPPPEAPTLQLKVQPADAILGPVKETEIASTRKPSFFRRVTRFTTRVIFIACVGGAAWAVGAYYASGHTPMGFVKSLLKSSPAVEAQQSPQHDELVSTVRQMADDIRALKASVDSKGAAQDSGAASATSQNSQLASIQTTTAAIADLTSRVDKLQADVTTKLSQIDQQLANIEQKMSATHVAAAPRAEPRHKRVEHLHDAFDPSQAPGAPGVPRPLGSR